MVRRGNEYEWAKLLYEKCWLDRDDADYYAGRLVKHDFSVEEIPRLSQKLLQDMGIHKMGHVLSIMKYVKELRADMSTSSESRSPSPQHRRRRKSNRSKRSPSSSSDSRDHSRRKKRSSTPPRRKSPKKTRERRRESTPPPRKRSPERRSRRTRESRSRSRDRHRSRRDSRDRSRRRHSSGRENNTVLDRTRKEEKGKIQLNDDELLNADISLPDRFKSKRKGESILHNAIGSGGPKVEMTFKPNKSIEERLGLRNRDAQMRMEDDFQYVEVKHEGRAWDQGKDRYRDGRDRDRRTEKLKIAEKPRNEISVMARIGDSGANNNNPRKFEIEKVEHKTGRHGKSHGLFAMDDEEDAPVPVQARLKTERREDRREHRKEERRRSRSPAKRSVLSRLGVRR